jgi:hypothetical protein
MNNTDKLRVLIPHWIEHNQEHMEEFKRWAENAGNAASDLQSAVEALEQVNLKLSTALEKLGGALPLPHSH